MNWNDFERARGESERLQSLRLSDSLSRRASYNVINAVELLAKHLRKYPTGMTLGELQQIAKQESAQSGT
jgi:ABC-type oligopeptide transport system ATPase subunit